MRFRFTIRDLLWLTVVAAVALAWWLDHRRLTEPYDPFLGRIGEPVSGGCLDNIQAIPPPTIPPLSQP